MILTADPTAVDPDPLDQIRVAETIKEGKTIFAATPEELKRTGRAPGADTANPFTNYLFAAADLRERSRFKGSTHPLLRQMAIHDRTCVGGVMTEIALAAAGGAVQ